MRIVAAVLWCRLHLLAAVVAVSGMLFAQESVNQIQHSSDGSAPVVIRPVDRAVAVAKDLQKLTTSVDDWSPDVPAPAIPLLKELKHSLRDFIGELLNDNSPMSAAEVEIAARAALLKAGVYEQEPPPGTVIDASDPKVEEPVAHPYGLVVDLTVKQPKGHPQLMVAKITLGIACGSDSALYVFEKRQARWELVLAQEANDYKEIYDALGIFGYSVSPPDANGDWYVATVRINPACISNWHGIYYNVMRPGSSPYIPRVLLQGHEGVYEGDEIYKLTAERDWFRVSWVGGRSLEPGFTRVYVAQYAIGGTTAVRTAPLAVLPQDFIDEWVSLPWDQAARWTSDPSLRNWHERLHRWHPSEEEMREMQNVTEYLSGGPDTSFTYIKKVQGTDAWKIGLSIEGEGWPDELQFSISKRQDAFFVDAIRAEEPSEYTPDAQGLDGGLPTLP